MCQEFPVVFKNSALQTCLERPCVAHLSPVLIRGIGFIPLSIYAFLGRCLGTELQHSSQTQVPYRYSNLSSVARRAATGRTSAFCWKLLNDRQRLSYDSRKERASALNSSDFYVNISVFQVYGLNFSSEKEARDFVSAVGQAIDYLNHQLVHGGEYQVPNGEGFSFSRCCQRTILAIPTVVAEKTVTCIAAPCPYIFPTVLYNSCISSM